MATALTLYQTVLRKLFPAEVDQNFINLRATADATAALNPSSLPVSQSGEANSIMASDANGNTAMKGVKFPAIQSASADPNTLDDYQEGTWTSGITIGGVSAAITSSYAKYTKIGNIMFIAAEIAITKGALVGAVKLSGLPTTSPFASSFDGYWGVTLPAGFTDGIVLNQEGDVYCAGASGLAALADSHLGATATLAIRVTVHI